MLEPPDLAGAAIAAALRAAFGLDEPRLTFLPIGNDAASWSYRVDAAGAAWFLKVRAGADAAPGAEVPGYLHRHGVPNVLAPRTAGDGAAAVAVDGFTLALYPMLDAAPGATAGLSPEQWRELGAALARVHATPLTPELTGMVGRESFRPSRRELVPAIEALVAGAPRDRLAAELGAFWLARRDAIRALLGRADELGRRLAAERFPQVLCHADFHTYNVLVDAERRPWIVDWDEAVVAPRERDLMFVIGGIGLGLVRPSDTASFLQGYGEAPVDGRLLTYYRVAWAVQDIAAYGEQALMDPGAGEDNRRAAVEGFMSLFEPGNIVDIATASADRPVGPIAGGPIPPMPPDAG
jgi:spectinomycin phosphotransferase